MKTGESTKQYEKIPENFLGPKIGINQFYIPQMNLKQKLLIDLQ